MDSLLEHYRVPLSECASDDGSTLWRRKPEPLGRGAYGEVWLEENASEGKLRAVKTVRYPTSERLHFNAEVFALVNLSQRRYRPFFGEFMGFYEDDTSVSFFMEYFAQRDLRKHLPEGAELPEDQARTIIRQILHGVRAMHEQNFTHRDLKPENIFVVSVDPWRVKIGDFGVAKKISDGRVQLQTKVGTEQYMAPEIFCFVDDDVMSPGKYSNSVDIWSCGVMLFELLTGERPFPTHAKLKAYCDGRYPFPDSSLDLNGISTDGQTLCRNLLLSRPGDRPTALEALSNPWFAMAEVRAQPSRTGSLASSSHRVATSPQMLHSGSPQLPAMFGAPPVKPLPGLPPHRSRSKSFRDEGYHTSSDRDVQEMLEFLPTKVSQQFDKPRTQSAGLLSSQDWEPCLPGNLSRQGTQSSAHQSPRIGSAHHSAARPSSRQSSRSGDQQNIHPALRHSPSISSQGHVVHQSPRSSPRIGAPARPARPDDVPSRVPTLAPISIPVHQLSIVDQNSPVSPTGYSLMPMQYRLTEPSSGVSPLEPEQRLPEKLAEKSFFRSEDEDGLGPLSPTPTFDSHHPRLDHLGRRGTNRSESAMSFQSGTSTSSYAELRETVMQHINDGSWKVRRPFRIHVDQD